MPSNSATEKRRSRLRSRAVTGTPLELRVVFWIIIAIFAVFLVAPLVLLLIKSFNVDGSFSLASYAAVLSSAGFLNALAGSFIIAGASALVTTVIAFMLAYTVNSTNVPGWYKSAVSSVAVLPMLLPTITYGFAIIYSFGRQGLITRLLGFQPFEIYGFNGLLLGYVIYTVPIAFMLINNTYKYIDKKFSVVSRVLGDNSFKTFFTTTFKPLIATLGASFIQAFFLSFTDFGIPASVGGEYKVVATTLYN